MTKKRIASLFAAACLMLTLQGLTLITTHAATEGFYTYTVKDGIATITRCDTAASGDIVIPDTLGGYPIQSIKDGSFAFCDGITAITIPNSVEWIGERAFVGCTNLSSLTLGNSVKGVGSNFIYSTRITSLLIPQTTVYMGGYSLNGATHLTTVAFENGMIEIPESMLADTNAPITTVIIPNSVQKIGRFAFRGCKSLTNVTIPSSVSLIEYSAFEDCTGITNLTISEGVRIIEYQAFKNCSSLMEVTLPDSLQRIGNRAFDGCEKLSSITLGKGVTAISGSFIENTNITTLFIPKSVTNMTGAIDGAMNLRVLILEPGITVTPGSFLDWHTPSKYPGNIQVYVPPSIELFYTQSDAPSYTLYCETDSNSYHYAVWDTVPYVAGDYVSTPAWTCVIPDSPTLATSITAVLNIPKEPTCTLLFALYKNNQLITLTEKPCTETDAKTITLTLPDDFGGQGYTIKAFVWDSADTMKPLQEAFEKTL